MASIFLRIPLPKLPLTISDSGMPCNVVMHVISLDSRSWTRLVSSKYLGSCAEAPLTTPGPKPRSHFSSEAFFGPAGFCQSSSPSASYSSDGLPSASIFLYSASKSDAAGWAIATPLDVANSKPANHACFITVSSIHSCGLCFAVWWCYFTSALSVRVSPLLSTQVTAIVSPFLADPLSLKFKKGSFETAGPN